MPFLRRRRHRTEGRRGHLRPQLLGFVPTKSPLSLKCGVSTSDDRILPGFPIQGNQRRPRRFTGSSLALYAERLNRT
jgi:hypothetical protein